MGTDYVIFYTEASIICIIILSMLLLNDRMYGTKQEKQIWFNRAIIAFILYFISDACWAAVLGGVLPRKRWLIVLLNFTNYVIISVIAYVYFMFMAASEKMPFRNDKNKRTLCLLPMVVSITIMAAAYIIKPYFWISEDGVLNMWYYPLMIAAPAFYLISSFVLSEINARKTDSKDEKRLFRIIGIFPLGVMAFGLLQVVSLNAPTFCFGCTIMWLWFYIQNMQTMISVDNLTGLNNRGQINRYMERVGYSENSKISIMMIDIDHFKQINDTYGHAEGDRALILVSETLKQTCEKIKIPVFLGRYGGDEFTIIIQSPGSNGDPEQITKTIRSVLAEKRQANHLPYELNISIGYDELRDEKDTMTDCMNRADHKLYIDKKSKGALR